MIVYQRRTGSSPCIWRLANLGAYCAIICCSSFSISMNSSPKLLSYALCHGHCIHVLAMHHAYYRTGCRSNTGSFCLSFSTFIRVSYFLRSLNHCYHHHPPHTHTHTHTPSHPPTHPPTHPPPTTTTHHHHHPLSPPPPPPTTTTHYHHHHPPPTTHHHQPPPPTTTTTTTTHSHHIVDHCFLTVHSLYPHCIPLYPN